MTRVSSSELFLIFLFAWGFASFLQGITGFGVPIAIVAPILVGFGVQPVYAVAFPLIAHVWGKLFGSLGEGWLATLQVVDVTDPTATAFQTALLLWIPDLLGGIVIAWFFGRWQAVRYALPLILAVSAIHGGVQAGMVLVSPRSRCSPPAPWACWRSSRWPLALLATGARPDPDAVRPRRGQRAGGRRGRAFAPANVALGTSSVGRAGEDANVMRLALPWTLITSAVVGLATLLLVGVT